ncbi:MAG: ATP-binding cassette domain-containing protein [Acetobacteraceae bacterium]|nr:ATP-binding cassette domain-containing protein [Acetobacteraceae bacterium]
MDGPDLLRVPKSTARSLVDDNEDLVGLSWPRGQLGQALDALASRSGLRAGAGDVVGKPEVPPNGPSAQAGDWIEWAAGRLGLEAEPVEFPIPELNRDLRHASPLVLAIPYRGEVRYLLLLRTRGNSIALIGPDLRIHWQPVQAIAAAVTARFEATIIPDLDRLLESARVRKGRREQVRSLMLRERLAAQKVTGCWMLRLPATAPFVAQLSQAGLIRRLGWVIMLLMGMYVVEIIGWALIGGGVLEGKLDLAWLIAWQLLLISGLPLRLSAAWLEATFALDLGRILKRRLLAGALRIDLDALRHQGAGQIIGRVMESQALETLVLSGGMAVTVAVVELVFAGWILSAGAGGYLHVLALLIWLIVMAALCWRYYRRVRTWSQARLDMTHELIEHMLGHRTRLAQEPPHRRNTAEDRTLGEYVGVSCRLDHAIAPVAAGAAGGWTIVAFLALAPAFILGNAGPTALAISLGGILMATRALASASSGLASLAQAGIAWSLVSDLFRAGGAPVEPTGAVPPARAGTQTSQQKVIDASDLVFRYRQNGNAILDGLNLTVYQGERVLLQGPSGGGKSTLAALLTGLRLPDSGLLLLNGLDRPTLGLGWHQLATEAPQFHENHILGGSLAFNLLMGRDWPPSEDDLALARALCIELGLGPLLTRMPSGMMQHVGETGWQLSHGERTRVFLARALLQDASLTILDESFAALDPATLKACLQTAVARARTLVVIAHP